MGAAMRAVLVTGWRVPDEVRPFPTRLLAVAAGVVLLLGACTVTGAGLRGAAVAAAGTGEVGACAPAWVGGWHAAVQPLPDTARIAGRTLRMVVTPQVTGSQVRVRLSNAHGATPLRVTAVSAAWSDGGAGLVAGTMRPVAIAGVAGATIAPGADVVTDPVPLVAEAGRPLAVSIALAEVPQVLTGHAVALATSYLSRPGDAALDVGPAAFDTPVGSWFVLAGVDVLAPRPVNAVVTVGDSLTDGVGSATDADERWSDALGRHLREVGGAAEMSVLNAGLSRNRLIGSDPMAEGETPQARFDRDVRSVGEAGATDVVLHIGTNDIAAGASADRVIGGLAAYAGQVRAAGARVFLTTITPADGGAHGTDAAEAVRRVVNAWVLDHGAEHADGVFDFAAAVADPQDGSRLAPGFDSGDGLHLSADGYRALAGAVDPARLSGSPCLAGEPPARVLVSGG